jgi:hypothetical protein
MIEYALRIFRPLVNEQNNRRKSFQLICQPIS